MGQAGKLALAALFVTMAGCGGDDKGGRCLTEAEVCQFTEGVSTKQQVQGALGNPSLSQTISDGMGGSISQWVYMCMPGQQSVQQVQFVFDASDVLMFRAVQSVGPAAPPAFTCN